MFLFRKLETRVVPAIKLPAAPLLASNEEMDAWLADYQAALDKTEPSAEPATEPAAPEQTGQLPDLLTADDSCSQPLAWPNSGSCHTVRGIGA